MKRIVSFAVSLVAVMFLTSEGNFGGSSIYAQKASSDKKIIEKLFAGWNSGDPDKVAAAFTEDGVYEDVTAGHVSRGRAEIREWAEGGFGAFGNLKMEAVSSSYHNGRGVTEWVWSATDKADKGLFKTGKSFSVRGVSVYEVRKGKLSRYREYYDGAAIMKQLGLPMPTFNE
jgi:steroid delta-isomerase-like uncharacterized protein